jgi:lysophospholipase L1-like esterase
MEQVKMKKQFLTLLICLSAMIASAALPPPFQRGVDTTNRSISAQPFFTPAHVVLIADSETAGQPDYGLTKPWPYWFTNLYATNILALTNCATVNTLTTNQVDIFVTDFKPWFVHPGTNAYAILWLGQNDVFFHATGSHFPTVAHSLSSLSNLVYACQSNNATVVLCTIPRFPALVGAYQNAMRTNLNNYMRTVTNAILVDLEVLVDPSWLAIDSGGLEDTLHISNEGSRKVAELIYQALVNDRLGRRVVGGGGSASVTTNVASMSVGDLTVTNQITFATSTNITANGSVTNIFLDPRKSAQALFLTNDVMIGITNVNYPGTNFSGMLWIYNTTATNNAWWLKTNGFLVPDGATCGPFTNPAGTFSLVTYAIGPRGTNLVASVLHKVK